MEFLRAIGPVFNFLLLAGAYLPKVKSYFWHLSWN